MNGAPWDGGGRAGCPLSVPPILTSVAVLGREMHKNSPSLQSLRSLFWEAGPSLLASWDAVPRHMESSSCLSWQRPALSCCLSLGGRWPSCHLSVLHWPCVICFWSSIFTQGGAKGLSALLTKRPCSSSLGEGGGDLPTPTEASQPHLPSMAGRESGYFYPQ